MADEDDDILPRRGPGAPARITVRPQRPTGVPQGQGWEPVGQEPLVHPEAPQNETPPISFADRWEPVSQEPVGASGAEPLPQQGGPQENAPTGQPDEAAPPQDDPWEPVAQDQSDPFELAALRTRQGVKPGAGRVPGITTRFLSEYAPYKLGQLAATGRDMSQQAARLQYEGDFDPGTTLSGAFTGITGAVPRIPGRGTLGAFGGRVTIPPALQPAPELAAGARVVRSLLAPETLGPEAARAAGLIRQEGGGAARDTARTRARLGDDPNEGFLGNLFNNYEKRVNNLDPQGRLNLLDYMENRSQWPSVALVNGKFVSPGYIPPELQPIADEFRDAMKMRQDKIQNTNSLANTELIQDYVTHYWTDPQAAANFVRAWSGKQGRGGNLKKRSIPTIAEGIQAGLTPVSNNPIEIAMRYVENMDKYIAANRVIDAGRSVGDVKYFKPGSRNIPTDWTELNGRLASKVTPAGLMKAYAPPEWALLYNNFISRGIHSHAPSGKVYDALQHTNNAISALQLGLSGFHAFTMANEAYTSGIAKGAAELFTGIKRLDPLLIGRGFRSFVAAPFKPITNALEGMKVAATYLGRGHATPDYRRVVKLLEQSGGRAVGRKHATDYNYSHSGSYWNAWRRGSLKAEMRSAWTDIQNRPIVGTAKHFLGAIGRIMDTVAGPLFERYIPLMKNGAFYDNMSSWLKANPGATQPQQLLAARKIWDSVDNRFGEMVHDNVFWAKTLKQVAMLGLRSYSWNLGTLREIGGGAASLLRHPATALDLKSGNYTPRAAYVTAMPMAVATLSAAYQYLKTGKAPESVDDLVAPRTGGQAPPVGGVYQPKLTKKGVPRKNSAPARTMVDERASLPGYQKDVYGWYDDWRHEAVNKLGPLVSIGGQTIGNSDWRTLPIVNPEGAAPEMLQQYMKYVGQQLTPFSFTSAGRVKTGSNISMAERLSGINPARSMFQDPKGASGFHTFRNKKRWEDKLKADAKQESQYQGPE